MRIIAKRTLREYWIAHADSETALHNWYDYARRLHWATPADVRARFADASFVGSNRVVFNIRGKRYRLVTDINYETGIIYIRFVGTHAEYDRIDAETI